MSMVADKDIYEVEAELATELEASPDDEQEYHELLESLAEDELVDPDERVVLWDEDDYEYYDENEDWRSY